jgi:lipopolysaccharide/colanic/teichoic acid biosynthesis glycosyltransferase
MYERLKRIIDFSTALLGLILLSPLWIVIVPILKFTGEGEIFYRQKRIGLGKRPFLILKFATMLKNSPNLGTGTITLRNDPRVTPAGRFLRQTKINELPQIWNVLVGEMSLVGPRPLDDRAFRAYPAEVQDRIYRVKPGITGIGSLIFRDEEALLSSQQTDPAKFYSEVIAPYKGEVEEWYAANRSLRVDALILVLTFWAVISPRSNAVYSVFRTLPRWNARPTRQGLELDSRATAHP